MIHIVDNHCVSSMREPATGLAERGVGGGAVWVSGVGVEGVTVVIATCGFT